VSTKLYAGNRPLSATAETLATKFAKFGKVMSVELDRNAATGGRAGEVRSNDAAR
jgi:RNA recognition motif-containing protein